jgi:hypothetical protein
MNQIKTILFLLYFFTNAYTQDIDVDKKSGLVKLYDKEAFCLKAKNIIFLASYFLSRRSCLLGFFKIEICF